MKRRSLKVWAWKDDDGDVAVSPNRPDMSDITGGLYNADSVYLCPGPAMKAGFVGVNRRTARLFRVTATRIRRSRRARK